MVSLGVFFALVALFSWGFGDFFIQKNVRLVGNWKALFYITFLGLIGLFPFVQHEIPHLTISDIVFLTFLSVVIIFAALFDFEALKQGKIAIIEPVMGLEVPITVGLAITISKEELTLLQIFLIALVCIGIILSASDHKKTSDGRQMFERGAILAGIGAIAMAVTNFLIGVGSHNVSPIMVIWFSHSFIAIFCFIYISIRGDAKTLWTDVRKYPKLILGESIFDNLAWVSYAIATSLIPISIAITISESFIALGVLLGLFVNKERLHKRQIVGIMLTIIGVIILSSKA